MTNLQLQINQIKHNIIKFTFINIHHVYDLIGG